MLYSIYTLFISIVGGSIPQNVRAMSRFSRHSLGAVLFVMLGGRYPFDGKAMPLEVHNTYTAVEEDFSIFFHWKTWELTKKNTLKQLGVSQWRSEFRYFMDVPGFFNHWSLGWNEEIQWISHDWTRIIRRIYAAKSGDWTNNTGDVTIKNDDFLKHVWKFLSPEIGDGAGKWTCHFLVIRLLDPADEVRSLK